MDQSELDAVKNIMAAALMESAELLKPIFEWAKGQKAQLVEDGWSSSAAEALAVELAKGAITSIYASVRGMGA